MRGMNRLRGFGWSDEAEAKRRGKMPPASQPKAEGEKPNHWGSLFHALSLYGYSICRMNAAVKALNRIFKYTFPF